MTAYPTPVLGGTPDYFHQNNRKGCKRDYLDARSHFRLRFGAFGTLRKTMVEERNGDYMYHGIDHGSSNKYYEEEEYNKSKVKV